MAPGIIGVSSGRPRPQGNMVHFSCLVKKTFVVPMMVVGERPPKAVPFQSPVSESSDTTPALPNDRPTSLKPFLASSYRPLVDFCIARSGDKGDSSNIGVLVRDPRYYPWIKHVLSEEVRGKKVVSSLNKLL